MSAATTTTTTTAHNGRDVIVEVPDPQPVPHRTMALYREQCIDSILAYAEALRDGETPVDEGRFDGAVDDGEGRMLARRDPEAELDVIESRYAQMC